MTPPVAAIPQPTIVLPTERTAPTLTFETARTLLYGAPGVGKTTLAVNLNPDTLLIAAEQGYGGMSVFAQPIGSWTEFRALGGELAKTDRFRLLVVDTVDELYRMCTDHMMGELKITHPSDLEYGKGWAAVGDEFKLRVGKLCSLGRGVVFISHEKYEEIKRPVGTVNKALPRLSGAPLAWLEGFVDYVLQAAVETTPDGERRVLRTAPSEVRMAKFRGKPLPDPIVMPEDDPAGPLRDALKAVSNTPGEAKAA